VIKSLLFLRQERRVIRQVVGAAGLALDYYERFESYECHGGVKNVLNRETINGMEINDKMKLATRN
jgi:hypothetical protein